VPRRAGGTIKINIDRGGSAKPQTVVVAYRAKQNHHEPGEPRRDRQLQGRAGSASSTCGITTRRRSSQFVRGAFTRKSPARPGPSPWDKAVTCRRRVVGRRRRRLGVVLRHRRRSAHGAKRPSGRGSCGAGAGQGPVETRLDQESRHKGTASRRFNPARVERPRRAQLDVLPGAR